MADYISALNGQQMDAALTEVALYNPEAWAVGQRNGVPVTSADETYHNNAKYYAQVAQSAIPGTYTAAVRWDIDQGLAGEAQEQARANISAGASNRNLLDNPWFTVNQRSASGTITNGQYGVDRWMAGGGTVTMATGEITLGAGNSYALQRPSNPAAFNNKTVTLSVMTSDGTVEYGSVVAVNGTAKTVRTANFELCIGYASHNSFYFYNTSASAKTVIAAKLELGSYSTLANDVPPKLREARADCQERFLRVKSSSSAGIVGFGSQTQSDRAYILIPTPVTMELNNSNTMSATLTGTARLVGNGSGSINVTSVSFISKEENGVLIACFGSNIAANVTYNLYLTSGSYIDISGDL